MGVKIKNIKMSLTKTLPQEEDRDNPNFSAIVSGLKNLSSPGKELRDPTWA